MPVNVDVIRGQVINRRNVMPMHSKTGVAPSPQKPRAGGAGANEKKSPRITAF